MINPKSGENRTIRRKFECTGVRLVQKKPAPGLQNRNQKCHQKSRCVFIVLEEKKNPSVWYHMHCFSKCVHSNEGLCIQVRRRQNVEQYAVCLTKLLCFSCTPHPLTAFLGDTIQINASFPPTCAFVENIHSSKESAWLRDVTSLMTLGTTQSFREVGSYCKFWNLWISSSCYS